MTILFMAYQPCLLLVAVIALLNGVNARYVVYLTGFAASRSVGHVLNDNGTGNTIMSPSCPL